MQAHILSIKSVCMELPYITNPLENNDLAGMSNYGTHPDDIPDSSINKFSAPIPGKKKLTETSTKYILIAIILILIAIAAYMFLIVH